MLNGGKVIILDDGAVDFSKTPRYNIKLNSKNSIILTELEFQEFQNSIRKFIAFELYRLKDKK